MKTKTLSILLLLSCVQTHAADANEEPIQSDLGSSAFGPVISSSLEPVNQDRSRTPSPSKALLQTGAEDGNPELSAMAVAVRNPTVSEGKKMPSSDPEIFEKDSNVDNSSLVPVPDFGEELDNKKDSLKELKADSSGRSSHFCRDCWSRFFSNF